MLLFDNVGPSKATRKLRQSPNRQFRNGERAAVQRALAAAYIRLGIPISASSSQSAAEMCGSNRRYVDAAITLLQAEDDHALELVLRGSWSLLETAARLKTRADLITAIRKSTPSDQAVVGRTVGVDVIWDNMIVPTL